MTIEVDYLVIGSGLAGLTYALNVAPHGSVALLTKKTRSDANSSWAQGGIAGVLADEIIESGAGSATGVDAIERALPSLRCEAGHSNDRIVHAASYTCRECARTLREDAKVRLGIAR